MARFSDVLTIVNGKNQAKLRTPTENILSMAVAVSWGMQTTSCVMPRP